MLRLPQLSTLAKYTKYNHLSNWVMNKSIITRVHCHEVYSLSLSLSLHWSRGILSLYLFRYTVTRYTLSLSLSLHCHEVYPLSISFATLTRGIPSLYLSRYTVTRYTLSLYFSLYTVTRYTLSLSLSLHCHEVYPLSISLATLSRGILSLYLSCSSTIKIQLRVFVYVKADIILISLKRNLFSPWYNWNIANLAMNKKKPTHSIPQTWYVITSWVRQLLV
jgi:hypothetical protein